MQTIRVILVGGFLGAGKTTLLAQAALRLKQRGKRVGLVANDQAADLVDTELLKQTGANVEEVAGGCFCCRFPDMISAMQRLVRDSGADVLIGEPVGSCADLSATVLQPLKRLHGHQFHLAPFTVLVDGNQVRTLARLRDDAEKNSVSNGTVPFPPTMQAWCPRKLGQSQENSAAPFPDNVLYIYEKQLEEADAIVLNKTDRLAPAELTELTGSLAERFPQTPILPMSALRGEGVDAWLDFVLGDLPAGRKITPVDYDTYAAGEAALGWMNVAAKLSARSEVDWRAFAAGLLESIRGELRAKTAEIAHLKLFLTSGRGYVVGNLTGNEAPLSLRGDVQSGAREASLLINARVHTHPDLLRGVVEQCLQKAAGSQLEATVINMRSFFPGRPEPTHRDPSVE
jgi:G3E family GTPase